MLHQYLKLRAERFLSVLEWLTRALELCKMLQNFTNRVEYCHLRLSVYFHKNRNIEIIVEIPELICYLLQSFYFFENDFS